MDRGCGSHRQLAADLQVADAMSPCQIGRALTPTQKRRVWKGRGWCGRLSIVYGQVRVAFWCIGDITFFVMPPARCRQPVVEGTQEDGLCHVAQLACQKQKGFQGSEQPTGPGTCAGDQNSV